MNRLKLKAEDLVVASFDPGEPSTTSSTPTIQDPNDPTPATWCRICPEYEPY